MSRLTRRHVIHLGAGLSCCHLSSSGLQASGDLERLAPGQPAVINIFLRGGLSHLDSFDPKPDAPAGIRSSFGRIKTSAAGIHVTDLWPELAKRADSFTILRSLHHHNPEHEAASRIIHTLKEDARLSTPSVGAVLQHQLNSKLPRYAAVPYLADDSGALGSRCRSYPILGPLGKTESDEIPGALKRMALLRRLRETQPDAAVDDLREQQDRVHAVLESPQFRRLTTFTAEEERIRTTYGNHSTGKHIFLARQAISQGMRYVVVDLPGWDMHTNLAEGCRKKMPPVDQAIAALLDDLNSSGLLKTTLVLVTTEFGRGPDISSDAKPGRGHWADAMSFLVAGGPVPGGQVVGDTGPEGRKSEAVSHLPDDLSASLYAWLEMDWDVLLPGEDAVLNTHGSPIKELQIPEA